MIDIVTMKGEKYSFDPETERIFKDGYVVPSTTAIPVYSKDLKSTEPKFVGIHLKTTGNVISLSGNTNQITDPNTVS